MRAYSRYFHRRRRKAPTHGHDSAPIVRGVKLSGLFIYPIKACAGIALPRAAVVERGLASDRRYMVVDRNGRFVSQRERPQLCLVQTAREGESRLEPSHGREQREIGTIAIRYVRSGAPSDAARGKQVKT